MKFGKKLIKIIYTMRARIQKKSLIKIMISKQLVSRLMNEQQKRNRNRNVEIAVYACSKYVLLENKERSDSVFLENRHLGSCQ